MSLKSANSDGIIVVLINRDDTLHLPVNNQFIAEELCFKAARKCGIGPSARHLFGLRCCDDNVTWLSPSQLVQAPAGHRVEYEFRLRFRVVQLVDRLQEIDPNALDYFFHQIRMDFLAGAIPEALKSQEKVLGLAVTDMLRVIKETKLPRETVEKDYKKYLPREFLKNMILMLGIRKAIHKPLLDVEHSDADVVYIKGQYVRQLMELSSQYRCEEYSALVDENGQVFEVTLRVDPAHPTLPGLWSQTPRKKNKLTHVCTICELCSISMRNDGTVEISRRNGIPHYFLFKDRKKLYSFVSLLDGYYRLMEKWIFNLCKDLPSPFLIQLRTLKCHGPVGRDFSYRKLLEKRLNKPGCYILREGKEYNTYRIDVSVKGRDEPQTLGVEKLEDGTYQIKDCSGHFNTVFELINYFSTHNDIVLKECVLPSEYDKASLLLLCRLDKDSPTSYATGVNNMQPVCIRNTDLIIEHKSKISGRLTTVCSAFWHGRHKGSLKVAVKKLKSMEESQQVEEFLRVASHCLYWHCEAVVHMYGIVLANPLALVMEYLALGPLDSYLKNNETKMQEVDLVEAATYLGKALWYLEEQGIVHGNIRCHNLLVVIHEENLFKIKLADPGIVLYTENQVHWIPPECYYNFYKVKKLYSADVWAFATTLWEIFSFGYSPAEASCFTEKVQELYRNGVRLPQPDKCHEDVYKLMLECWTKDPDVRKKPQAIMRDINQILYEVHNSRRTHAYATIYSGTNQTLEAASELSFGSSALSTCTTTTTLADTFPYGVSVPDKCLSNKTIVASQTNKLDVDTSEVLAPLSALTVSPSNVSLESMAQDNSQWWLIENSQLKLLDKLGQGFYGEVRRGILTRWSGLEEQEVAVKQLKPTYESSGYHDLLREIAIMKSLQHKNIVEIKGVVEDPKTLLVMEFVPLGSMLIYIRTRKHHLSEKKLLKFSADIAEGMEYLGQRRIVHRDLAARNILVASSDMVKISDFGLAQMTGQKEYYMLKTNRELPIRWYAPETLRNWRFTFKSDVWSFGVTLWEMFSYGEEPIIEGCKDDELLQTLESGKRLRCPASCSVRIYTHLMRKCWEEVDENRPDFSQLLTEIRELNDNS